MFGSRDVLDFLFVEDGLPDFNSLEDQYNLSPTNSSSGVRSPKESVRLKDSNSARSSLRPPAAGSWRKKKKYLNSGAEHKNIRDLFNVPNLTVVS